MKMGIDISTYQNGLNFETVKNDKIDFVIIRGGFTGEDKKYAIDDRFVEFYEDAKKYDIPVGIYYYSRAISYDEGKNEAEFLYENCLKGRIFEYPVYIDVEDSLYQEKASKEDITNAIKGFCDYIQSKNGYAGVYCNLDWADNHMNYSDLSKLYDFWLADWDTKRPNTDKYGNYGMWQYGGSINLIRSNKVDDKICDQDYAFKDYPAIMSSKNLNDFIHSNTSENTNTSNEKSNFENTIEKELVEDVESGIEEEVKTNKNKIFNFIFNLFKKIIEFFFIKLKK